MNEELGRIKLLLAVIHNENMTLMKMFLPRDKGNEIVDNYKKQFEEIWNKSFDEE